MDIAAMPPSQIEYRCPGCSRQHRLPIGPKTDDTPAWRWNGSTIAPSLYPSVLYREFKGDTAVLICHHWVRDGVAKFLADSTHDNAGQQKPIAQPITVTHVPTVTHGQ